MIGSRRMRNRFRSLDQLRQFLTPTHEEFEALGERRWSTRLRSAYTAVCGDAVLPFPTKARQHRGPASARRYTDERRATPFVGRRGRFACSGGARSCRTCCGISAPSSHTVRSFESRQSAANTPDARGSRDGPRVDLTGCRRHGRNRFSARPQRLADFIGKRRLASRSPVARRQRPSVGCPPPVFGVLRRRRM